MSATIAGSEIGPQVAFGLRALNERRDRFSPSLPEAVLELRQRFRLVLALGDELGDEAAFWPGVHRGQRG